MPLNDTQIKNLKPKAKPYKLADGGGLWLFVQPNGSKWWRMRYRVEGREKMLSLGVYPDVSLKRARDRRDEARSLVADGQDPSTQRKAEKAALATTFEGVALDLLTKLKKELGATTYAKAEWTFRTLLFPYIGKRPIAKLTAQDVLAPLKKIEQRGHHETAHRAKNRCSQVFRHAVQHGLAERDVTVDLKGALTTPEVKHHASITNPSKVGALLRAIDGYDGSPVVKAALQLAPLVFLRPSELRGAEWAEFNLKGALWEIPGTRMKMDEPHIVPLSKQAITILQELQPLTGRGKYVFPGARSSSRPLSDNALNAALRRMGFDKDTMTGHGFRAMARTILDEVLAYRVDWIEHQLAHEVKDVHGRAYNRTAHLTGRKDMMQGWADYLDARRHEVHKVP